MVEELGRMEKVDPGLVWRNEARDFTPWLLDNPDVLAATLGIDVELEAAEHPVGGFSLDRKAAPTHTPAHHPREEALAGARARRENRGGETDQPAEIARTFFGSPPAGK